MAERSDAAHLDGSADMWSRHVAGCHVHMGDTQVQARLPALDALRGLAILLVVSAHVGLPGCRWGGQVGVVMFFVLSGFLITRILLRGPSWSAFYARRAARLLPALVLIVAANVLVTTDRHWILPVLGYVSNWWSVSGHGTAFLGHTWSLAVEEQFYLVWPALLGVFARRGHRLLVGAAVLLAWRVLAWRIGWDEEVQWGTVSNAFGLLLGGWVAVRRPQVSAGVGGLALLVCLVGVVASTGAPMSVGFLVCVPVAAVLTAVVVSSADRLPAPPLLTWVGGVSYGWYLWHNSLLAAFGEDGLVQRLALVLVGLGIAVLSLHVLERPVQRWVGRALAGATHQPDSAKSLAPSPAVLGCPRRGRR